MRILNAESVGYSPTARGILAELGEVVDADLDQAQLAQAVGGVDVLIVRLRNMVHAELLQSAAPRLHTIVSATTGLDHIDQNAAADLGIAVLSLKGETDFLRTITATAEHTWALLLSLIRHVPDAVTAVRTGQWDRDQFRGTELKGKRLGLVGLGRIGTMVASYGHAFGMNVSAHDPFIDAWPTTVERVQDLTSLVSRSDVLSIHVPLDPTTTGLLSAPVLAALPAGALVVNTSRGAVVDEQALCDLVANDHVGGVAADVTLNERSGPVGSLRILAATDPRVILTPHIGGATHESMESTEIFMASKLKRLLSSPQPGGRL